MGNFVTLNSFPYSYLNAMSLSFAFISVTLLVNSKLANHKHQAKEWLRNQICIWKNVYYSCHERVLERAFAIQSFNLQRRKSLKHAQQKWLYCSFCIIIIDARTSLHQINAKFSILLLPSDPDFITWTICFLIME